MVHTELYCYKSLSDEKSRTMHSLIGTFVQTDDSKFLKSRTDGKEDTVPIEFFPFKIIFPINKVRIYYCKSQEDRQNWVNKIIEVTNHRNIHEFYTLG